MLEIRPVCENCGKNLPYNSLEAMICTFECTFCSECVHQILHNVCPNCGGGFEKRPIRPKEKLIKYPSSIVAYIMPIDFEKFKPVLEKNNNLEPASR